MKKLNKIKKSIIALSTFGLLSSTLLLNPANATESKVFRNINSRANVQAGIPVNPILTIANGSTPYKKNVTFTFKVTDNTALINQQLEVVMLTANKADYWDDTTSFWQYADPNMQGFIFTVPSTTTTTISKTFVDVPLLYLGKNYISCDIYNRTAGTYEFCGGNSNPYSVVVDYTGDAAAVYRFWSNEKQKHFYTASAAEQEAVELGYNINVWMYERVAFFGSRTNPTNTACVENTMSKIYRFWSDTLQGHFYTIDEGEKDAIIAKVAAKEPGWDWKLETPSFTFCGSKIQKTGMSPVYRFWSNSKRTHFYTIDEGEKDAIIAKVAAKEPGWDWTLEGIRFYLYK